MVFPNVRGLAIAGFLSLAITLPGLAQNQAYGVITGTIADKDARLSGADVTLLHNAVVVRHAITTSDGRFRFEGLLPDSYVLQVTRIGYVPVVDTIPVQAAATIERTIEMTLSPVPIASLTVSDSIQREDPRLADFWRRRMIGLGHFFTRADIERKRPHSMTDLFRDISGLHVFPTGSRGNVAASSRMPGICGGRVAVLYVDGSEYKSSFAGLNDFRPEDIAAVEVYSGTAQLPAEFKHIGDKPPAGLESVDFETDPACGVIVLWTRRGGH